MPPPSISSPSASSLSEALSSPAGCVGVLLFGPAREAMGNGHRGKMVFASVGRNRTVGNVRSSLAAEFPQLGKLLPRSIFALNDNYVALDEETTTYIKAGDELALIPPISGGKRNRMIHPGLRVNTSSKVQRRTPTAATTTTRWSFISSPNSTVKSEDSSSVEEGYYSTWPDWSASMPRPKSRRQLRRLPCKSSKDHRRVKSPYSRSQANSEKMQVRYFSMPWMAREKRCTERATSSCYDSEEEYSPRLPRPKSDALLCRGCSVPDLALPRLINYQSATWSPLATDSVNEVCSSSEGSAEREIIRPPSKMTVLEQFALLRLAEKRSRSQKALVDPRAWRVCSELRRRWYNEKKSERLGGGCDVLFGSSHESLLDCI
ncbi:hypothetical protein FOL47_009501 [Perkinsus chesapeaki]|uniref:Molybdopterin synthase sulfur carrier subunit n=1 Tax=Perkinsus chesapeaki TaxID=330153 RepID=A0A7J6L7W8_PERCH|nr:hypothetical protein FOL47_009501 [Perkinsus chesapeaki]